jgi:hypothetical protein
VFAGKPSKNILAENQNGGKLLVYDPLPMQSTVVSSNLTLKFDKQKYSLKAV